MDRSNESLLPFRDLFFSMKGMEYVSIGAGEQLTIQQHDHHMLIFVIEGTGILQSEERLHQPMIANDMMIVQPGERLLIENVDALTFRFYSIHCEVYQVEARGGKRNIRLSNGCIPFWKNEFLISVAGPVEDIVKELYQNANSSNEQAVFANHFLFQKLIYVLADQRLFQKQSVNPRLAVKRTIQYLSRHYHEAITVDQLAKMANVSRRWYTSLFKELTGENPGDYVIGLRMRRAKELLNLSEGSFGEIARRVGFEDEHYFSRRFKQMIGMSPRHYKQNRRHFGTTVTYPEMMHALGITPVAAPIPHQEFPFYLREPFKHVQKLEGDRRLSLEEVRLTKPDLIIASEWQDKDIYEELRQIAATVLLPNREDWRDELRDMADIFGKRSQAIRVIQSYEDKLDEAREKLHPLLHGESVVYIRCTAEGITAFGNKSSRGRLLYTELGLQPPNQSLLNQYGEMLSIDQLFELESNHILLQIDDKEEIKEQLLRHSKRKRMSADQRNQVHIVGNKEWYNFSFSPLSTNFALHDILNIFASKSCKI